MDQELEARVQTLEEDMTLLKEGMDEILDIIRAAKGFFKVLGFLGVAFKWLAGLGAAAGTAWAAWQSWGTPGSKG